MKTKWKDTPLAQRIVTVFSIVIALSVIVLAVLQILKIWTQAINLCIPLMGVNLLCQTYVSTVFKMGCCMKKRGQNVLEMPLNNAKGRKFS